MWVILAFFGGLLAVNGVLLYLSWRKAVTPRRVAALWAGFWGLVCFVGAIVSGKASTVSLAVGTATGLLAVAIIYTAVYHLVRYLLHERVRE